MTLFITGGAGFIGSNFILMAIGRGHRVLNYDALTYAGNLSNLENLQSNSNYSFVHGDICDRDKVREALSRERFDAVINFAAESHVDRSVDAARIFSSSNVLGTATLAEAARELGVPVFIQISTDEVYGSISGGEKFTLNSRINPTSPYSASKAGGDFVAMSFHHTHGYDVRVTRCSNNYGRFQHPEKFIPTIITRAIQGKQIPVYGDGKYTRDWIFVDDHCEGIFEVLEQGKAGKTYLFGGSSEVENIDLVREVTQLVAKYTGKNPQDLLALVKHVTDRPGHDRRYAIDWSGTNSELGWKPRHSFNEALDQTVKWYCENEGWWIENESRVQRTQA